MEDAAGVGVEREDRDLFRRVPAARVHRAVGEDSLDHGRGGHVDLVVETGRQVDDVTEGDREGERARIQGAPDRRTVGLQLDQLSAVAVGRDDRASTAGDGDRAAPERATEVGSDESAPLDQVAVVAHERFGERRSGAQDRQETELVRGDVVHLEGQDDLGLADPVAVDASQVLDGGRISHAVGDEVVLAAHRHPCVDVVRVGALDDLGHDEHRVRRFDRDLEDADARHVVRGLDGVDPRTIDNETDGVRIVEGDELPAEGPEEIPGLDVDRQAGDQRGQVGQLALTDARVARREVERVTRSGAGSTRAAPIGVGVAAGAEGAEGEERRGKNECGGVGQSHGCAWSAVCTETYPPPGPEPADME